MDTIQSEIERKFLVRKRPPDLGQFKSQAIRQGYAIISAGEEVRIRSMGADFSLAVKKGTGVERMEAQIALTPEQFDKLWPLTEGRRIDKIRYYIPEGEFTIELDVFKGDLEGLITAEVEFSCRKDCDEFAPPAWLGDEITYDERYKNKNLSLKGREEIDAV